EEKMGFIGSKGAALASVALTACLCSTEGAAQQPSLSAGGIYGGGWADSIRGAFLQPHRAKLNVQVRSEEGISGVTLAKLRQQKDDPQFDVVWMDRGVSDTAIREGLLDPISPAALTNTPDVVSEAFIKDSAGRIMAVTTGYWAA